jgi:hypothetical protein
LDKLSQDLKKTEKRKRVSTEYLPPVFPAFSGFVGSNPYQFMNSLCIVICGWNWSLSHPIFKRISFHYQFINQGTLYSV